MKSTFFITLVFSTLTLLSFSQVTKVEHLKENKEHDHASHSDGSLNLGKYVNQLAGFNLDSANQVFNALGYHENERFGNIQYMKTQYLIKKYPELFKKKGDDVIIPMKSANCPNAGFENLTFQPQWAGGTSTITVPFANTSIISNGINAAANDPLARHTILTSPAVNNNPLFGAIVGYDPVAINPNTGIAAIPFVAPNGNGSSVRLGNSNDGYERERLRYVINVTPSNKSFYYQFAVVLQNPSSHTVNDQPYFKISFFDQNNQLVGGNCGQYNVISSQAATDTSFKLAQSGSNAVYYRPWDRIDVDLTQYIGQQITVEFETGDCNLGGHYGYAYIDAGCQESIDTEVNFCAGDPFAELVAPAGFTNYQWYGPNSSTTALVGETNDTLIINSPNVLDTFYVAISTLNGCQIFQEIVINFSVLKVKNISTVGTCFGSNIGSVEIEMTGSNQGYNFNFQPINIQNNLGKLDSLYAGTYLVHVSAPNPTCGIVDTTFTISVPQIYPSNVTAKFCEGIGEVTSPLSNNYKWYDHNQNLIPSPIGTSQTIIDSSAYVGKKYYLVYQLSSGCYDSLVYTFFDNKTGSAAIIERPKGSKFCRSVRIKFDDFTPNSNELTFSVNGPAGYNVVWYDTLFTQFEDDGLDTGLYFVRFIDEGCIYDTTFRIVDLLSDSVKNFIFCPTDEYFLSSISTGNHQWTNPLGTVISTNKNVSISNIIEGAYIDSCQVTPGCYELTTFNLDSITIETGYSVDDNFCNGGSDGAIYMEYKNGPPGNTVFIATGNGITAQGDTLTGLPSGYYVVQTKVLNCVHSDTIFVGEPPISGDTLTIYAEICDELTNVYLEAPKGYLNYQWYLNGNEINGQNEDYLGISYPNNLGNYSVTYSVPPLGCTKKTIKFETQPFHFDFEPSDLNNVFTPNTDMVNNFYHPFHDANWPVKDISEITRSYRMVIYNRWGNKIWETEDYTEGWNGITMKGNLVDDGVYYAEIQYAQKCESPDYIFKTVQKIQVVR